MKYSEMTDKQLDELVATKVMGYKKNGVAGSGDFEDIVWKVSKENIIGFHPTTDYNRAFEVVEKMIKDGWVETSIIYELSWQVEFFKSNSFDNGDEAIDISLPRAICRAALKAVEND